MNNSGIFLKTLITDYWGLLIIFSEKFGSMNNSLYLCRRRAISSMPRQSRKKSGTGIYHVMLRGINRQDIFEDEEDYLRMVSLLRGLVERMDEKGNPVLPACNIRNHGDWFLIQSAIQWIFFR